MPSLARELISMTDNRGSYRDRIGFRWNQLKLRINRLFVEIDSRVNLGVLFISRTSVNATGISTLILIERHFYDEIETKLRIIIQHLETTSTRVCVCRCYSHERAAAVDVSTAAFIGAPNAIPEYARSTGVSDAFPEFMCFLYEDLSETLYTIVCDIIYLRLWSIMWRIYLKFPSGQSLRKHSRFKRFRTLGTQS